jgi:hypothetical protein
VLTSGVAILGYAARFLLFGTRWGVNSTFFMAEPGLRRLVPDWQWTKCTGLDPAACNLRGQYAQQQARAHPFSKGVGCDMLSMHILAAACE